MKPLIELCKELYTIYRSLTGDGVRKSLQILSEIVPYKVFEVPCGTKVFDWTVPPEWNIKDAYVIDLSTGKKVIDFKNHNLHIVGYSEPVNLKCSFEELEKHLYHLKDQPDAIPYITSYYSRRWGFCLSYRDYMSLDRSSQYQVVIDSAFNEHGSLTYAEYFVKGETEEEIFFSSYICHPQMLNNELSGPMVLTAIAHKITQMTRRRYSYRFVLIPETIGSITYLSRNIDALKKNVVAGFNITCVGDERTFGYVPSRNGQTISDEVALYALSKYAEKFETYTWLDRGSDERQYCAPGVDLPVCTITRSKYGTYPEYHTSLDNFDLVTEKGLQGSVDMYMKCVSILETNCFPKVQVLGEPQLGKRGLYPTLSTKESGITVKAMMNFISYADGTRSIFDIAKLINVDYFSCLDYYQKMKNADLMK